MRIDGTKINQFESNLAQEVAQKQPAVSESVFQNGPAPSGINTRAAMRQAESGIGANLLASQIRSQLPNGPGGTKGTGDIAKELAQIEKMIEKMIAQLGGKTNPTPKPTHNPAPKSAHNPTPKPPTHSPAPSGHKHHPGHKPASANGPSETKGTGVDKEKDSLAQLEKLLVQAAKMIEQIISQTKGKQTRKHPTHKSRPIVGRLPGGAA